jgi:hypothetical protein
MTMNRFVFKSSLIHRTVAIIVTSVLCLAPMGGRAVAQSGAGTIEEGVTIPVRTVENIRVDRSDGRIFAGQVDRHVYNRRGTIALPEGTPVELMVRQLNSDEYILDLESVLVNGQRLTVSGEQSPVFDADDRDGLGGNSRTGRYVGTGAIVGAIIGALTGGGKGAAIGGGVGAAAGAGTQLATRGRNVIVPAESLVTFRLERPLRVGAAADDRFSRNGVLYRYGYGMPDGNTAAYEAGLQAGRADRERNRVFRARSDAWRGSDAIEYRDGYERGYNENPRRQARNNIQIGADRYIRWSGPADSRVYVQTDNRPRQLFSGSSTGVAAAPWIAYGHRYVFTLVDRNGREIARDVNDLRRTPRASN